MPGQIRTDLLNVVLGNPASWFVESVDQINLEEAQKNLDIFKAHGFKDIDTARAYGIGEQIFAKLKAEDQGFIIDTKVLSFAPGTHKAEKINESVKTSLEYLNTSKVNILYLHAPERTTPFEETLRTMNELYKQGKYEKFGLSNYTAAEVKELLAIADKHGWVRPTVYQGNYNLLTRKGEAELFPLLKKEKIAFYAWSPLAGGLLTGRYKTKEDLAKGSHFSHAQIGPVFSGLFSKDTFFNAIIELEKFAAARNLTLTEVALRWLAYHSQLKKSDNDAIILGGSRPEQYEKSLQDLERGPLPADVVEEVEKVWERVQADSASYHF